MYTGIRKILYLPKFFAFFSTKIDSLTYFETHDCPLFCPNFLPFLAPKLIHLLTLTVMTTSYFPQIFCPFSTKLDSLTYIEADEYHLLPRLELSGHLYPDTCFQTIDTKYHSFPPTLDR